MKHSCKITRHGDVCQACHPRNNLISRQARDNPGVINEIRGKQMKAKFIILFIVDTIVIILLTYFSLYEIDRHAFPGIIITLIGMVILAVYLLFRLYLRYIRRFPENSNLEQKK